MKQLLRSFVCASAVVLGVAQAAEMKTGLDVKDFDPSVRPQDDINAYVNGKWIARTEIPSDQPGYGSFEILADQTLEQLRGILEETAAKPAAKGSDAQRIGDFYRSYMNTERIEALGLKPLEPAFAAIRSLKSKREAYVQFARLSRENVGVPFDFGVSQDAKDSSRNLAQLSQSGTTMPDRDYYLVDDPKFVEARKAFVAYATKMLGFAGYEPKEAARQAEALLTLETAFAKAQRTQVALRDPEANYHKMPSAKLTDVAPTFPWSDYLEALGAKAATELNVGQPEFITAAVQTLESTPLETIQAWMLFKTLEANGSAMPARVVDAIFDFHGKAIAGVPLQKPRWKMAVYLIGGGSGFGALGDAVGRLYVDRYFPTVAKQRMDELVHNLLLTYGQSIQELSWMTPETKVKAQEKLAKYTVKIGYTAHWRDYSSMTVSPDDIFGNLQASFECSYRHEIDKLGKAPDRAEWAMTPQTVNAYYEPTLNEIVFPAAILQPPFFTYDADDAVNYGGIGAVIGHEISHGFDDEGCQFDGDGNLRNWWTDADAKAFKELTGKLVAQYAACEALPGKHVNGELTLGENIADLSGLAIAYKAYRLSLHGKDAPVIDGLTGDQRFFLGWAQVWRSKYREALVLKLLLSDPHSPEAFRIAVPLTNNDAFMKAFGLKPGDKLYKPESERIRIW